MPTYEYRCKDCGHELEAQQSFQDDPLTECPSCGGELRKKFSAVGISFKGSGFYKNDSRGSGGSSSSGSSSGGSTTAAGSTASTGSGSDAGSSTGPAPTSDSGSSSSTAASTSTPKQSAAT